MEDQKVRDPETDDQREQPGQNRELDGLVIEIGRQAGTENVDIVLQRRACDDAAEAVALHEARGKHHQDRRHEERQQHQHQRRYVEPAESVIARGHEVASSAKVKDQRPARSGPAPEERPARARQATLKSFQRLFM
jgi:hypothetical protein